MTELVRSRVAMKGWVTRAKLRLATLVGTEDVDLVELQDAADEFDTYLAKLDAIQSDVERELDDDLLIKDISDAADFRESARKPRVEATKLLKSGICNNAPSICSTSAAAETKLPKLNLPKFSGESDICHSIL